MKVEIWPTIISILRMCLSRRFGLSYLFFFVAGRPSLGALTLASVECMSKYSRERFSAASARIA